SELADRIIELLSRQLRMLKSHRCESDKPIRMRRAPLRETFVLNLDDLCGEIAIGAIPPRALVREHLDVDSLLIDHAQPLVAHDEGAVLVDVAREIRTFDDFDFFGNHEMSVNVDHLDTAITDRHFSALRGRRLEKHSGHYGRGSLTEIPPIEHGSSPCLE